MMKKMATYRLATTLMFLLVMVLVSSCKSVESAVSVTDKANFERLVAQLDERNFRIDIDAVFPFNTAATTQVLNSIMVPNTGNSASRIEVRGAGHYIEIQGNTIKASLPYFGEQRQSANNYGKANVGIEIDGGFEDYSLEQIEKKNRVQVKLKADDDSNGVESYDVIITSFPNGDVSIGVFSTHRTSIRYRGTLSTIEEKTSSDNGH